MTDSNEVLLDQVEVFPHGGIVVIEDFGTFDSADSLTADGVETGGYDATEHSIDVYTFSADEADTAGRGVTVRVYSGGQTDGLGTMIFDGQLDVTSGVLAIGGTLQDPEEMHRIPLPHHGSCNIKIFANYTVSTIHYTSTNEDRPASGPSDIVVLISPAAQ